MKTCNEIKDLLSLYLDNELHENVRKQVVKHLEGCNECKRELEELKIIIESVSEIEEEELPAGFASSLHDRLIKENESLILSKPKYRFSYYSWAVGLTACIVLIIGGTSFGIFGNLFTPKSEIAYVNDAELDYVNKNQMAVVPGSVQIKGIDNTQSNKAAVSKSNKNLAQVPTKQKSFTPAIDFNKKPAGEQVALNDKAVSNTGSGAINDVNYVTLLVADTSNSLSAIRASIVSNGGQIEETESLALKSSSVTNDKNLTITVPMDSYNTVLAGLQKIGTVENGINQNNGDAAQLPNQTFSIMAAPRVESASTAQMDTANTLNSEAVTNEQMQNVTIELKIQQK